MERAHTLVVIRHAKAEDYAADDHARHLTDSGIAAADDAGRWLASSGVSADAAYVSAATRTRETWARLAGAAGWSVEPEYDDALYATDEDGVLEIVCRTDEAVGTLVVVGHNPSIGVLAQILDDGEGAADVTERLVSGYPTAGVLVLDVPGPWAALAPMGARPRAFHVGRG
ncbi:MAG: histidine phosphatase family protein [Nocardioidaceae bacterium]|nr:histidine phosphatase family protein [Nocardioidaceae bacterium]MCL2612154.1 histidine phosphatase family protein [Nocardioidaceae bacterium]